MSYITRLLVNLSLLLCLCAAVSAQKPAGPMPPPAPVTVAVSTGGSSPALASWMRRELEAVVGPEFADVALRLAEERRRIHAAGASTESVDWAARIEAHLASLRAASAHS